MWWILVMNFNTFVLSKFRPKLLAANHLIIWQRNKFDNEQKSVKCLLDIMTLVSSGNNISSDTELILRWRSLIYFMNTRGPRTDPYSKLQSYTLLLYSTYTFIINVVLYRVCRYSDSIHWLSYVWHQWVLCYHFHTGSRVYNN